MNLTETVGYLGIDESNYGGSHNGTPEVYVAVYSEIPNDVLRQDAVIGKIRNKTNNLVGTLENRTFYHILVKEKPVRITAEETKVIVFSELIRIHDNLDTVIIDGKVSDSTLYQIQENIASPNPPNIVFEPKADLHYPIVNIADRIAYILFQYYSRNKSFQENNKYSHLLLKPEMGLVLQP